MKTCEICDKQSDYVKSTVVSNKPFKTVMECDDCYAKRCKRDCRGLNNC